MLTRNKLENVKRRAVHAGYGSTQAPMFTCAASRHLMLMADALRVLGKYHMLDEEPEHCAGSIYAVLESLWKARAEIQRLKERNAR